MKFNIFGGAFISCNYIFCDYKNDFQQTEKNTIVPGIHIEFYTSHGGECTCKTILSMCLHDF